MSKKHAHLLMVLLIAIWAMDSVTVSVALDSVNQIFLLCAKYAFALPIVFIVVALKHGLTIPKRKDFLLLIISALLGDVLYFFFEYTALKYLSVSTVTILLGFLPAVSYLTDCAVEKKKPNWKTFLVICISIAGLILVVINGESNNSHKWIGYACCAICIIIWIIYGYLIRNLDKTYSSHTITLFQMATAFVIMLPIAISHIPTSLSGRDFWISIVLMGILSGGFGCLIEVKGLVDLGTTISGVYGVYLNLLPVFTALAGVLFLHEHMTLIQCIGSVMIIVCGFILERQSEK